MSMRRGYAETRHGQMHLVEAGAGPVVLLLHQSPRSWDEFRDVIPLLARTHRVIAADTLGFGASATPPPPWSIEMFADGLEDLVADRGIETLDVVGHHTGGVIAVELATRLGDRVDARAGRDTAIAPVRRMRACGGRRRRPDTPVRTSRSPTR